ncbi:MAG: ammonia-forming cytochrome c nitrite reductase subunit c552, partial [Clostridia bacterium]|nr:ammonia-forming cytochrome c nitrite reductase subunit c552 [Clostridia bacterium]
ADCSIASSGDSDLMTDDIRSEWAQAIVDAQSADADANTGATLAFSAASDQEAVDDILAPASGETAGTAEAGAYADGTYTAQSVNDFSTVDVEMTIEGGKIADCSIASSGDSDLMTDDIRSEWAQAIVDAQSADADAITGATLAYSAASVQEAVDDILAQASGETAGEADADDARVAELEAAVEAAEARIAELESAASEAEARADEAEAKVAELEAAAGAAAPAKDAAADDASKYMRARPAVSAAAEDETAAEEAAPVTDAAKYMRAKPAAAIATEAEEAADETASSADASKYMRARPASAASEEPAEETADEPLEDAKSADISAVLPYIVTSMGDNKQNSYVTDYLEQDPYLVNIYEGYGFAKDYGSARGHEYTLEDVAKTQRPHPKANCLTCKTPDFHKLVAQEGVAVYSMPFDDVMAQMTVNISCYTCHGDDLGGGGALQVTHQYVNEALGENVAAINPATLSCGQCHIEYYFTPADSETMMPYHDVAGMAPEVILAYYDELDFADWTQESTGTRMLKAQHPEMETFLQGKHAAFLSCADCHMPPEATPDGAAYHSHMLVSPLQSEALLETCAKCHGDTDMVAFVHGIQDTVTARETEVGNKLSGMKDRLAEAVASGKWNEEDLNAVRKLHREAQWFFDYCYVENSEGAHNSQLSLGCLDVSEAKIDEALALLDAAEM